MKNVKNRIAFVLSLVLFVQALAIAGLAQELPRAKPEDVGMSSARLSQLSTTLDGYVKNGQLAGGVAMVMRRGKIVFLHTFGSRDREANSPMKADSIFRIASQSKACLLYTSRCV